MEVAGHGAAKGCIGGIAGFVHDTIVSARNHFADDGRGQHLLDLVGLGLVHESGNRNRLHIGRQGDGVAGSVIAAAGAEKHCRQ